MRRDGDSSIVGGAGGATGLSTGGAPSHPPGEPILVWNRVAFGHRELGCVLYTPGCRWAKCTFCVLPSVCAPWPVAAHHLLRQLDVASERAAELHPGAIGRLFLSNNGSVLDTATLSRPVLNEILRRASGRFPRLGTICLETRISTVGESDLRELVDVLDGAREPGRAPVGLEINSGYETQDPHLRNTVLRKGYTEPAFHRYFAMVGRLRQELGPRLQLTENVMVKPCAGMSSSEAIVEAVETIDHVARLGRDHGVPVSVRLHPTYVAPGSALFNEFRAGRYTPPTGADVLAVVIGARERTPDIPMFVGLDDEGFAAEDGGFCTRARRGRKAVAAFEAFNNHQELDRLVADCPADWSPGASGAGHQRVA